MGYCFIVWEISDINICHDGIDCLDGVTHQAKKKKRWEKEDEMKRGSDSTLNLSALAASTKKMSLSDEKRDR